MPQVLPLTHADAMEDNRKGTTGSLNTGLRTRLSTTEHPRLLMTTVSCGNQAAGLVLPEREHPSSWTSMSFVLVNVLENGSYIQTQPGLHHLFSTVPKNARVDFRAAGSLRPLGEFK